jgi:hypothetical protein
VWPGKKKGLQQKMAIMDLCGLRTVQLVGGRSVCLARYGTGRCDAMREVMWVRELHGRVSQTFEVVVESWGWNKISRGKTVLLT